MFSLVLKIAFLFIVAVPMTLASEGAAKEAAPKGPQNKPDEDTYTVIQARVAALEAKIRSGETEIGKLIAEKQHTKDPEKLNEIIRQMISVHTNLKVNAKEYDQQRALLKYRYPEKGLSEKREYERIQVKSLEEMESQANVDSSLAHTLKKVRSQYKIELSDGKPSNSSTKKTSSGNIKRAAPVENPSGLTDAIILKK